MSRFATYLDWGRLSFSSRGHSFDRAPDPAAIAFSSLLLYSLTLRRGRAGRATKGALRGAAARAAGTACCARRAEPRMDIAGAAIMLDVSSTEEGCQNCRDVCLQTECAACRSVDQSHEACTLDGRQQKGIRISKPPRDVSTLGLRVRSYSCSSVSHIWSLAIVMGKEGYACLDIILDPLPPGPFYSDLAC